MLSFISKVPSIHARQSRNSTGIYGNSAPFSLNSFFPDCRRKHAELLVVPFLSQLFVLFSSEFSCMEHFSTFSWLTFIECQNSLISYTLIFSGSLSGQDLVQILIVQGGSTSRFRAIPICRGIKLLILKSKPTQANLERYFAIHNLNYPEVPAVRNLMASFLRLILGFFKSRFVWRVLDTAINLFAVPFSPELQHGSELCPGDLLNRFG